MHNIIPTTFSLLYFCFKNLDVSDAQLVLIYLFNNLINLFLIASFLNQHYLCVFYNLSNKFACFIMIAIFFDNKI